jgi:hypothetical protein
VQTEAVSEVRQADPPQEGALPALPRCSAQNPALTEARTDWFSFAVPLPLLD